MMRFTLYWGVYAQWTKEFPTVRKAIDEALRYVCSKEAKAEEFKLIQLVEFKLTY